MNRALDVFLHDACAGVLTQSDDGNLSFAYQAAYLSGTSKPAISVSTPRREEAFNDTVARPYFSGLLPDERARRRLASMLGISSGNAFGLLKVIGGECAGALSLLPQGTLPPDLSSNQMKLLGDQQLEATLELLRTRPLLGGKRACVCRLREPKTNLSFAWLMGRSPWQKMDGQQPIFLNCSLKAWMAPLRMSCFACNWQNELGWMFPKHQRAQLEQQTIFWSSAMTVFCVTTEQFSVSIRKISVRRSVCRPN